MQKLHWHIDSDTLKASLDGCFRATADFPLLAEMDCILICVPTPLNRNREPDMTYVFSTGRCIAATLRKGQLVILESTTYPGTTDGDLREILEGRAKTSPSHSPRSAKSGSKALSYRSIQS